MGALAAVGPAFAKLARAADKPAAPAKGGGGGRVHMVESTKETVQLGVFDETLPPILTVESGDTIVYPNTWSHFMNEMQLRVSESARTMRSEANASSGKGIRIGYFSGTPTHNASSSQAGATRPYARNPCGAAWRCSASMCG